MEPKQTLSPSFASKKQQLILTLTNEQTIKSITKSPRVSFQANSFSKKYKKDDIYELRQAMQALTHEEAESLPFGTQNELLKLAEIINDKLERSSQT
jgi:hypothetical protein